MTTTTAHELDRRQRGTSRARRTFAGEILRALVKELESEHKVTFPSPRYQANPVAFFREILGVEPWARQIEILHAIRDYDRVAVKSGRRIGKSHIVAGIALWWYCSWPDARAIMSSTTARQVDQILWRELSMLRARAGRCVDCKTKDPNGHRIPAPCPHSARIEGDIGMLARTGLKSDDFREIVGFTAREAEAVQGIAGSRLLFIIDEASGVPQPIFDAIEGNRAGGGKALLFGNPTRNKGEFYDAFFSKALNPKAKDQRESGYYGISVSSEESPNVLAGREVIRGLATADFIRERELEWGRDSALFRIHVQGEFATNEEGKIFSVDAIRAAEERWHETPEAGRLFVGLDPAGPTGSGDETVFAMRRGLKLIRFIPRRALNDDAHLVVLLGMLKEHRVPRETPVVVVDREGPIGSSLYGLLRGYAETHQGAFEVVGVRSSNRAVRKPQVYDRMRDELTANLEAWLRDGGALLEDAKLSDEMHQLEWEQQINGKLKVTRKDKVRKELGRSPDRYDALALSVWEPLSLRDDLPASAPAAVKTGNGSRSTPFDEPASMGLDPYGGADTWRR